MGKFVYRKEFFCLQIANILDLENRYILISCAIMFVINNNLVFITSKFVNPGYDY